MDWSLREYMKFGLLLYSKHTKSASNYSSYPHGVIMRFGMLYPSNLIVIASKY